MKKKILIFFVINLLIANCINCQTKIENSVFWEITGNGLKKPSYLLGTHHLVSCTFIDSISGFRKAFHSVRQVAVESTVKGGFKDAPSFFMPSDTTYQMLYTPKEFEFVDSVIKRNVNLPNPYKYKPFFWYLINLLSSSKSGTLTLDALITNVAKSNSYKLIGLEGKEELNSISKKWTSSVSLKDQASTLLAQLKKPSTSIKVIVSKSISDYKEQNLNAFEQNVENLEFVNAKERNQLWMKKIPGIIKLTPTLIVVGVGHLVGEYGLINQLRKQGFTLKPMNNKT